MAPRRRTHHGHRRGRALRAAGGGGWHARVLRDGARELQGGAVDAPAGRRGNARVRGAHREAGARLSQARKGPGVSELLPDAVSDEQPWPGLMPFTEGAQAYFHGRETEAAELFRLIRRETVTVLFGQSG